MVHIVIWIHFVGERILCDKIKKNLYVVIKGVVR